MDHLDPGPPPDAPPGPETTAARRPRGHAALAWLVIAGMIAIVLGSHLIAPDPGAKEGNDPLGVMLMRMQSQYMVGAADLQGSAGLIYAQARKSLNIGSIGQRQRFVVLAGELAGTAEAAARLAELRSLIEASATELTGRQEEAQRLLGVLYPDEVGADEEPDAETARRARGVEELTEAERATLTEELGWFGRLALAPAGGSDGAADARQDVLAPAHRVVYVLIGAVAVVGTLGFAGFVGAVVMIVLACLRRVASRLQPGRGSHGIYAETFAIWLVLFFALQFAVGAAGSILGVAAPMWVFAVAFLASLIALAWPVARGIPWADVRADIGLHGGTGPVREGLWGLGGYCMALPVLGIGIAITLLLLVVQQVLAGAPDPFAPSGGPAHPIILEVGGGGWWPRLQLLLVASVAAPIVEETMFRGVLYRHLRDASHTLGLLVSILLSGTATAFVFAVIHPQGWVAVPALMSLAYAFVLLREWRGSLIAPILVHGISNGVVMTMLMMLLGASS